MWVSLLDILYKYFLFIIYSLLFKFIICSFSIKLFTFYINKNIIYIDQLLMILLINDDQILRMIKIL